MAQSRGVSKFVEEENRAWDFFRVNEGSESQVMSKKDMARLSAYEQVHDKSISVLCRLVQLTLLFFHQIC